MDSVRRPSVHATLRNRTTAAHDSGPIPVIRTTWGMHRLPDNKLSDYVGKTDDKFANQLIE